MKAKLDCPICGTNDWQNVDEYRDKKLDMCMCTKCGFVSYPNKWANPDEAKAYYRKDYRQPPTFGNAVTGQRKLHYHAEFLKELIADWKKRKKKAPVIGDVGAAYGIFLNWARQIFKDAKLFGTEWTDTYKRNAFWEYNIRLEDDLPEGQKFDLLMSYKVAEHQVWPDKELRKMALALGDEGRAYISVPQWYEFLGLFGESGYSIEDYYHPNHINVWSRKNFEVLLKKSGLEIIKFDNWLYNESYLCKRNDSLMDETPEYDSPEETLKNLKAIKEASDAFVDMDFKGAVAKWPYFPAAHTAYYEMNRAKPHLDPQNQDVYQLVMDEFVNPAIKACPHHIEPLTMAGDISMRYGRYTEALKFFETCLEHKPNNGGILGAMSHCLRHMADKSNDPAEQQHLRNEAREMMRYLKTIDMNTVAESVNWIYRDNAGIPIPPREGVKNG